MWRQIGDHLVVQLGTAGHGRAYEELAHCHGLVAGQSGDVCAGRPCGRDGRHPRKWRQPRVDALWRHVGAGAVVGHTPIRLPVRSRRSRTASSMIIVTGRVAAGDALPVEVWMKSAPANIASQAARPTLSLVTSSPVSRTTNRCAGAPLPDPCGHACLMAAISLETCRYGPDRRLRGR
jgi:hypothetical protein